MVGVEDRSRNTFYNDMGSIVHDGLVRDDTYRKIIKNQIIQPHIKIFIYNKNYCFHKKIIFKMYYIIEG